MTGAWRRDDESAYRRRKNRMLSLGERRAGICANRRAHDMEDALAAALGRLLIFSKWLP
jgi:hypothetical protein